MKKLFACILFTLLSSIAFAQDNQAKLERAEAIAIANAVSLNDNSKALDALLAFEKGKEVSAAFLYNVAILHANLNNLQEALLYYKKALSSFDNFYLAHKNIAFCYANLGQYELALKHISKAAALAGLDLQMYKCVASANLHLENYAEALFALKNAQMLEPKEDSLNDNILFCLSKLEQWQELKLLSEKILETKPKSAKAWRSLVLALLNLAKEDEVIAAIEAMKLFSIAENKDLEILASSYFNKEIFTKAIPLYASLKESIDAEKLAKIANALVDILELDKAIELAPDTALGDFAKARAYKLKNDFENSQVFVKRALAKDPLAKNFLMLLAQMQLDNGDFANAKLNLNRLEKDEEYAYRAKYLLSYIAIKEANYEEALRLLRQIRNSSNFDYIDSYIKKIENFLDE